MKNLHDEHRSLAEGMTASSLPSNKYIFSLGKVLYSDKIEYNHTKLDQYK